MEVTKTSSACSCLWGIYMHGKQSQNKRKSADTVLARYKCQLPVLVKCQCHMISAFFCVVFLLTCMQGNQKFGMVVQNLSRYQSFVSGSWQHQIMTICIPLWQFDGPTFRSQNQRYHYVRAPLSVLSLKSFTFQGNIKIAVISISEHTALKPRLTPALMNTVFWMF